MTKLILDLDTGTDDAVALMLAALEPRLELLAATTVAGNAPVAQATENTLRVLDHVGRSVPVYPGAAAPLSPPAPTASRARSRAIHGTLLDLPPARSRPEPHAAARLLTEAYAESSDTVLVATAPLTNLATALRRDPGLARRIPRVVLMGGSTAGTPDAPSPDFNFAADPEAARAVLRSGIRELVVVPLDATSRALLTERDCALLAGLATPAGTAAAALVRRRIEGYRDLGEQAQPSAAPVHDVFCVAHLLDDRVLELRDAVVAVETAAGAGRGCTVVELEPAARKPNARWAVHADRDRLVALLLDAFA